MKELTKAEKQVIQLLKIPQLMKNHFRYRIVTFLLFCMTLTLSLEGSQYCTYLIKASQSDYSIVIDDQAISSEITAAKELAHYIREMTGVELTVVRASENHSQKFIAVGFSKALPPRLSKDKYGDLRDEELIIDRDGTILLLAGGRPRGTLYAVYEYLHQLGVRWYTPDYTKIPKLDSILIPQKQYRYFPPITRRNMNSGVADNLWRARNRLTGNTLWSSLGEEYGSQYSEGPDMHTFWRLVPDSVLKKHPDWLAETDGIRELPVGRDWGLCLSNPNVRNYLINRTVDYARKKPTKDVIWIGQNDGSQYCTCDRCQSFYNEHGGKPSSLIVNLVNELSDAIAEEMPDKLVKTLAYSWSLEPPENMKLRENVIVMFCPMGDFTQPIAIDPNRANLRKALYGWRKITKHMDCYIYFPYEDYWSPAPCTYSEAENIKWCASNGFDNLFLAVSRYISESVYLRSWVYSRLLWNPDLDAKVLIDEFIQDYYGPVSSHIAKAIQLTHEDIYNKDGSSKKQNDSWLIADYVDPAKVHKINRYFEKIYSKLPENVYKKRFRFAWLPYLWADFWLGFNQLGEYDSERKTWSVPLDDEKDRISYGIMAKDIMIENNIKALNEQRFFDPNKLGIDKIGVDWQSCLLQDGTSEVVVIPGVGGRLYGFHNKRSDFLPLKELFYANTMKYPLNSTTQESVNGTMIADYNLLRQTNNKILLQTNIKDASIKKEVVLQDGILMSTLSLESQKANSFSLANSVMLDLAPDQFGFYPVVFIEQKDGSWITDTIGVETDFWWIADDFDLSNSTGRIVFKCEESNNGLLLMVKPEQLKNLNYWYSRFDYHGVPPIEYCGMMRLFLNAPKHNLNKRDTTKLSWAMQILPNITEVVR